MNFKLNNRMLDLYFLFVLPLIALNIVFAAEVRDMGGWEKNGKYNRYYDLSDSDSFKGKVIRIKEVVPLPGNRGRSHIFIDISQRNPGDSVCGLRYHLRHRHD